MIELLTSATDKPNPCFSKKNRGSDESNVDWVLSNLDDNGDKSWLLFVGGRDVLHFRLRAAQSHARHDLTPSHWSHVALLNQPEDNQNISLFEIALDPTQGFGFPPACNGVQRGTLSAYGDVKAFPNVALASLPVTPDQIRAEIEKFEKQRAVFDTLELTVHWLSYLWGVGDAPNPLLQGHGIPSAAMAEVVLGAVGLDLTPGLADRSSCPEAIWQSVRWWHEYHGEAADQTLAGKWHIEHRLHWEVDDGG